MAYDVLIRSGTVVDGSGAAPFLADIGISGDKISHIGELGNSSAPITINALGKIVSPGFIDVTNHSDTHLSIFKYPDLESLVTQGITTIVGGNCGASLAPLASSAALDAVKKWANPAEMNANWNTIGEYLDEVDRMRLGVNMATLIGFGTLKRGIQKNGPSSLTLEEREQIKHLLRQGMKEGALGLSLGLSYGHERNSSTEEIINIVKVLQNLRGVVTIHLRSEGIDLLSSVNEAINISREGISVHISHLKAIGKKSWPLLPGALELIGRAKNSGINISFDVSPYRTTGSQLYLLVPAWARQGGFGELFGRMDVPEEKAKIIDALRAHTLHYDKIRITSAKIKDIIGKTITEIAVRSGMSPEETLLDTVRANEGRVSILGRTISMENTVLAINNENSCIASNGEGYPIHLSDSGDLVHPRSFGAFPRFLGRFADLKNSPAQAIKKVSARPAEILGISRRGALKKNYFADIVVLDPKQIRDRASYENPFQYPTGIEWVIINGKVAVRQGKHLAVRSGRAIRKKS